MKIINDSPTYPIYDQLITLGIPEGKHHFWLVVYLPYPSEK